MSDKLGPVLFISAGLFLAFWALSGKAAQVLGGGGAANAATTKPAPQTPVASTAGAGTLAQGVGTTGQPGQQGLSFWDTPLAGWIKTGVWGTQSSNAVLPPVNLNPSILFPNIAAPGALNLGGVPGIANFGITNTGYGQLPALDAFPSIGLGPSGFGTQTVYAPYEGNSAAIDPGSLSIDSVPSAMITSAPLPDVSLGGSYPTYGSPAT